MNYSWCLKSSCMSDLEHKKRKNWKDMQIFFPQKNELFIIVQAKLEPFHFCWFCSYIYINSFPHFLLSLVCVNMLLLKNSFSSLFLRIQSRQKSSFCAYKYWLLGMSVWVFVDLHFIPLNLEFLMRKSLCYMVNGI